MNSKTKPGDVVRTNSGVYRMYYQDPSSNTGMRCMNLCCAESYDDNEGNAAKSQYEEFVFNMKELIESACADKL